MTACQPRPPPAARNWSPGSCNGRCEWCQHRGPVHAHQVRKLADLGKPGPAQPGWASLMARMRRKTLIVCAPCHQLIHDGKPAAICTS